MNICTVGAGYVGLTTSAVLAELGHVVDNVDHDESKINRLNQGDIPIYEPGLSELVERNRKKRKLYFSTEILESIARSNIIVIAVGTPSAPDGSANLVYVRNVLLTLASSIRTYKIIVIKSTVPPGTGDWAEALLLDQGISGKLFDIVSNPEFLREGTAIDDTLHPDRIVIGASNAAAAHTIRAMYNGIKGEMLITGRAEAELIKYGSNAFLATKLSFVNELARVCDVYQADITEVAAGIGMDNRIGGKFLQAGIGYGGSCLPKDVNALIAAAAAKGRDFKLLRVVAEVNASQLDVYVRKLEEVIGPLDSSKHIAVWGAAFKENTDDIRYSQAIALMEKLAVSGCRLTAYDPLVAPAISGVEWKTNALEAAQHADALVVATGWLEFIHRNWEEIKSAMKGCVIMDGRNVLDKAELEKAGFRYVGVGRP